MTLVLRNARGGLDGGIATQDVVITGGRVAVVCEPGTAPKSPHEADLAGTLLLPGLVNAHDHLDFSTFPPLGRPPYASAYAWAQDVDQGAGDPLAREALAVPLVDRLWLGGLRNLLAGVTAVAHHGGFHRCLMRADFPVRVLAKYDFAHSPGLTPRLRQTYRSKDRRVPWMVHAGEGTNERCRRDWAALIEARVLRHNTVVVHGIAFGSDEAAQMAEAEACLVWCPESNRRLYDATADVQMFRAAGVRVGLGSDSPVSGVRDALSNLAAARRERVMSDDALLRLATHESGVVARLPVGDLAEGAPADFVIVRPLDAFLSGDRRSIALVVVAGRPLFGMPELMAQIGVPSEAVRVDGALRRLSAPLARRFRRLCRGREVFRRVPWIAGIEFA